MQPRLKAGLWVRGQIAICQSASIIANGCFVYSRVTTLDGDMGWMQVAGGPDGGRETEFACDEYWRKQVAFDRDVWVLEVEDHKGEYELDAPIVDF